MSKEEVDKQMLTSFVVMPLEIELCFNVWWKDLPDDHEVVVRYPFERHGLAGRVSNHAKTDTKEKFFGICRFQLSTEWSEVGFT